MAEVQYVEEQLPSADVSGLLKAVKSMDAQIAQLSYDAVAVNNKVNGVSEQFETFLNEFRKYVAQDLVDRRYQEALAEQVQLQQQLDEKFSRHQRVRRYVVGILQAADAKLVRKETVEVATSELMIAIPHYWLVPALVAIAAWINDNQPLAEKALREAIARDDEKTSLLFALICRRASRNAASLSWLQRYFAMQDPMDIERKMIVVLDAYANGMFGGDSRNLCAEQIGGWIAEMEEVVGFRETQVSRWENAISAKTPSSHNGHYPYLEKYATNWSEIHSSICNAGLHNVFHDYVRTVLEKPNETNSDLKKQLDELLDSLVTNYDNAELPLRQQKRIADLIVEHKGDENAAMRKYNAEKTSFDEKTDLMQLLTNAAMNPELVHASNATQKLSMAMSKEWMIEAYNNVTLSNRAHTVNRVNFNIEGYEGDTFSGENEDELKSNATVYFEKIRDGRIASVKQSTMDYFLAGAGILLMLVSFVSSIPWFIGVAAAGLGILKFYTGKKNVENTISDLQNQYAKLIADVHNIISALCAECVDFRREIDELDSGYDGAMEYLQQIAAHQFVKLDGSRNIHIS